MQDKPDVQLRRTEIADLKVFFGFQRNKEARLLAAFTPDDPDNETAYLAKHTKFLSDPKINNQTILLGSAIVGSIAKFEIDGQAELTYWIDRNFWGQGVATRSLKSFLSSEAARPIFGRVAFDNFGSQRVLEKCGFLKIGTDRGFANARQEVIEEYVYKLS